MAYIDTFVKGKAYRVHTGVDASTGKDKYDVVSFKTASDDVFFDNGTSLTQQNTNITNIINKNLLTYATGTLVAGQTTVTVTGSNITANGMLDIYVPIAFCKVTPEAITNQINGSVTIRFPAQSSNMQVRVTCRE